MAGFDPTQVPTFPVEIDWSHPLARFPGGSLASLVMPASPMGVRDIATGVQVFSNGASQIGASARGPGAYFSGASSSQYLALNSQYGTGSLSIVVVANPTSISSSTNQVAMMIGNDSNSVTGWSLGIYTNTTPQWVAAAIDSSSTSANATGGTPQAGKTDVVAAIYNSAAGTSTLVVNGAQLASQGGIGAARRGNSISNFSPIGIYINSGSGADGPFTGVDMWPGTIPVAQVFYGALPSDLAAWVTTEPFAMLRPVRRRTYFVPASAPSSNIGASLVATSSLSASLRGIGAIRASAAATSQVQSSLKGVGTIGASLAATSTLSSAWFILPNIGASLAATSALSVTFVGAFPILPGRSISVLPSIRFIVAPVPIPIPGLQFRVPTFSPRAPNDVDFFTVDLGETGSSLIGTPAVTVPTGDLTIAGVTVSGSQVTFTVSGPGTPAAYSQLAIAWQTGNGAFSQTFQVLTNGFVAAIPVNSPAGILLPAPFFGSRATGDVSYFQLDMTGIVPAGAAITSAIVSCPTGDMTVGAVLSTATSVAWEGSGSGTIGQASGFAVQVAISTGAQLTFFAAIETMAPP